MASLATMGKAAALKAAISAATGEDPRLVHFSDYSEIRFSPEANRRLRARFERQMGMVGTGDPADVRIDLVPIVGPYVAKRVAAVLLISLGVGFIGGRLFR